MDKTQRTNSKWYDNNYLRWSKTHANSFFHEKRFRQFIKYFSKNSLILDIGCAYAIHAPLFLGIGRQLRYQGIDISKGMLRLAKARYPQLDFRYGDIADGKTLPKGKFDGFWAAAVLMHVPKKEWPEMLENLEK